MSRIIVRSETFQTTLVATRSTNIISAARVAFFWVVNSTSNEKSCLQFLIPTAVFHMLLRVGSIPTLHLKTFEQLFSTTT